MFWIFVYFAGSSTFFFCNYVCTVPFTSELYTYWKENGRTIRVWKSDPARRDITTCSIWLAWSTTMVNIGRYKQYPGSISRGNIDRYPTYNGGKVTEVIVYANYIGLRRFYRYVVNIGRWSPYEGGQLDGFHYIYIYIYSFHYIYIYILLIFLQFWL
jgi:hypothetical protein